MLQSKILSAAIPFLLAASLLTAQTSVEKNLVKSFNLQGEQLVMVDLPGPVAIQTWDQDLMRVQLTVRLSNGSENLLKSLVMAGRYNLKGEVTADGFLISCPGLAKTVTVQGQELEESFEFSVWLPKKVTAKNIQGVPLVNTSVGSL